MTTHETSSPGTAGNWFAVPRRVVRGVVDMFRPEFGNVSTALWMVWLGLVVFATSTSIGNALVLGNSVDWSTVALTAGAAAAGFVLLLVAMEVALEYHDYANHRLRHRMGPLLADWLGTTQVSDDDLRDWRRARRAGITVKEAQRWSDHGFPFPLATSARKFKIDLPTVEAPAGVLRDAEVWDGQSREDLEVWLGSYPRDICDYHPDPVLHRWVKFSPDQIRAAILTTLGPPGARQLTLDSAYEVLTALDPDPDSGKS